MALLPERPMLDLIRLDLSAPALNAPPIGWGISKIGADSVWASGVRGDGTVIAILDSGVRYAHVDLADHLWTNADEIPGNGIDDDSNGYVDDYLGFDFVSWDGDPMDDNGHGTFVAGLAVGDGTGGICTGVAPEAQLMSVKVVDSLGGGNPDTILVAVEYAVDNGADVICMAIGWADPDGGDPARRNLWRTACKAVGDAGVVLVATVGYGVGGPPYLVAFPASIPPPWLHPDQTLRGEPAGVIGVLATDSFDFYAGTEIGPTEWSDFPYVPGSLDSIGLIKPDLSAPGADMVSLDYGSDTSYVGGWSSSGCAAAHIAGAAALLLSAFPSFSAAQIDSLLEMTSVDLGTPGKDNKYGAGRLDVWAAYNYCIPGFNEEYSMQRPRRSFRLLQNSPNPFSISTTISYTLQAATDATLTIYDITGRMVETLVNETQRPGIHQVRWERKTNPSGVYFYRLSAGEYVETRKMVVID